MTPIDGVYWTTFGLMWAITIATLVVQRRRMRQLQEATADTEGFARWANWQMLTVIDRQGDIHSWTLRQMYQWKITDRIWADPVSVSLWAANGELYQQWQTEAVQLFAVPPEHDQENDCG